jgi:hypothetical protein
MALDSTSATSKAQALLVKEFESHQSAAEEFPPAIRIGINAFTDSLKSHYKRRVCSSCGVFSPSSDTIR